MADEVQADPLPTDAHEDDEARAIERACAGDTGAYESLYRRYVGRIYAVCLRMTADVTEAEECTQQTFISAWEHLGRFKGNSALRSTRCWRGGDGISVFHTIWRRWCSRRTKPGPSPTPGRR